MRERTLAVQSEPPLLSERAELAAVRRVHDDYLKHVYGKYKLIGVNHLQADGEDIRCVFLSSKGRYYKTNSQHLGYSYGHAEPEDRTAFINLTKKNTKKEIGHWFEDRFTLFYNTPELSLTIIHEFLHLFVEEELLAARRRTGQDEETMIVTMEKILRRSTPYTLLVVD